MGVWGDLVTRLKAANAAFRKPDIISDPLDADAEFNEFDSRRNRYNLYWSFYENTQYIESVINNNQIKTYKKDFGLYRYIRSIYNPSYRLGEFWKAHLWGGALDTLPIETENEALKDAIAQIFVWSNWEINKDVTSLYGSVMGDVGIKIVDDSTKDRVYLEVVHPGTIAEVELDPFGNVKAYIIEEDREDPVNPSATVTFSEVVTRDGDKVIYRWFRDGAPFPWNGEDTELVQPYGFVPFVMIQHNNVGLDWGWSEIHPGQSKFREVDDLGSKLDDQIRKLVDPFWLFSGVQAGSGTVSVSESNLTGQAAADRPQPGREETNALYGPVGASATPLVAPLDIAETSNQIKSVLEEIERDFPELRDNLMMPSGEVSGRALRLARQPVEVKVNQRRPNYDNALVRALQMAVAIGGQNNYFAGFNLASFDAGQLAFTIGNRPIFGIDPMDDLEILLAKSQVVQTLTNAGASILSAAKQAGFDDKEAAALSQIDIPIGVER